MSRSVIFAAALCSALVLVALATPVPTTLNDFTLSGSQPNQSGNLENPSRCDNCHGGYGEPNAEPTLNWRGSMMAQAARDPLFYACMAIANQDAPQSGDLCIRCHAPKGWLEGRSVPTDGSALTAADREGVQCDFCHKLVKPTAIGVNPYPANQAYTTGTYPRDQTYLGTINPIPPNSANGMYIADSDNAKRGPFSDPVARHQWYYSPFHSDANHCGTCHDVSNPVFTRDGSGRYLPNAFNQPAPSMDLRTQFPIERTFSEWLMSAYNSPQGVYAPQFGGNRDTVRTCQDCHMRDVTGHGCQQNDAPLRTNMPKHDLTGGNTVVPAWVAQQYPNEIYPAALDSGVLRARYMLQQAATMTLTVDFPGGLPRATVRVTNETGHKLPSGYPEGRRIWLNIRAFDANNLLVYESCAYDTATAVLTHDADAKIYEIKPGLSPFIAGIVNHPPGPSFHFVQNDTIYFDNRIPPRGFTNANFALIQSPPVGYAYTDGQYWDDSQYLLPATATRVEARLFYQTISKEYIEFLRDANVTNNAGTTAYNRWAANGKSRPELMRSATQTFVIPPPGVATNPVPANGAVGVPVSTTVFWMAGSGAVTHTVYFGTITPPPLVGTQSGTSYDPPGDLAYNTTYYWRVDESNAGGTTPGAVWSFQTMLPPPMAATDPFPADQSVNVMLSAVLFWTPGLYTEFHRVYFGTTTPPPEVTSTILPNYDPPGDLVPDLTYYWRITEVNGVGETPGPIWSFTTITLPPDQATNPDPSDFATDVPLRPTFAFTPGARAVSHRVYLGTAEQTPLPLYGEFAVPTFVPTEDLHEWTSYLWRVDEVNAAGTTPGIEWSFTTTGTLSEPEQLVIIPAGAHMQLQWLPVSHATYYSVYRSPLPDFPIVPQNLIVTVTSTTFVDSNVVADPAIRYFYAVTADRPRNGF